jgi:lactoylglutathione lyase
MFRIHHFAMEVADVHTVSNFYIKFFGFEEVEKVVFMEEKILFLRLGDFRLELIQQSEECFSNEKKHLCFETTNLYDCIEKFSAAGLEISEGPYMLKNGWKTVFYKGPVNEYIEIIEIS